MHVEARDKKAEFSGTHRVVLPSGYMDSIDFAVNLYREQLSAVATNLEVQSLKLSTTQKIFRYSLIGLIVWLAPASWMICI